MSEHIAYCGLDCFKCDAYQATQTNDTKLMKQIAERWNNELGTEFTVKDIICDGCLSQRISGWCQSACSIRPCAEKRNVKTCAHCKDYPCDQLESFLATEPLARARLDGLFRTL